MQNNALDVQALIETLERRGLGGVQAPKSPFFGQLDGTRLVRISGMTAFWKQEQDCRFEQYMADLISGFHGQDLPFGYLILGRHRTIEVYVGIQRPGSGNYARTPLLISSLKGSFPGIQLGERPEKLGSTLVNTSLFNYLGRLTGIPTLKSAEMVDSKGTVQQIERLLRALYGETWGYWVQAQPTPDEDVNRLATYGYQQLRNVSSRVKKTVQLTPGVTGEEIDRHAQYAVELLEKNHERLEKGKTIGMWEVEAYFFADTEPTLLKAKALLKAIFAGEDSRPQPLRTFQCVASVQAPHKKDPFSTLLNSDELSVLCQLPREEMPGYAVRDYARFGVSLQKIKGIEPISIGEVLDIHVKTGHYYTVDRSDFARHGLVVGVTGSGKTNTLFHLLDNLWRKGNGVPFLVIEPAKAEYRDLRTADGFQELRVFTLGDERWAPFRLNPFEFEIGDADNRIHVQTHIDYLKSVFNAAFILYAPMPYVLETCLHEIYQDTGWDLTTSQNRRIPLNDRGNETQWPVFPTLTDLYNKIEEVVDRLGYEERIQMDVKAGMKARVGSLRLGGKGLMLDVLHSIPMKELLAKPTVLELERIGNDDEKSFLIGLLLTRLYEHRVVEARSGQTFPSMQHVTVFEEAHRLFKNISTETQTEEANVKGQSVEVFANMLSEIRAYGEGILIAEQVPTKLAPDAIKNTNLKIMHRIVAQDDREVMGGTMNLDEPQKRHVTTLSRGQAVVYAEGPDGADQSYLVQVDAYKHDKVKGHVLDRQIQAAMQRFMQKYQSLYEPLPGFSQYVQAKETSIIHDMTLQILEHPEFQERYNRYFLSLVEAPHQAVYGYKDLVKLQERVVKPEARHDQAVRLATMLHGLNYLLADRGRRYGWFYRIIDSLQNDLTPVLCDIVIRFENRQDVLKALAKQHEPALQKFAQQYKRLCAKASAPHAGCVFCQQQCVYRYEVSPLILNPYLRADFADAEGNSKTETEMWHSLAQVCTDAADRAIHGVGQSALHDVALCFASQMGADRHLSPHSQRSLVKNIKHAF